MVEDFTWKEMELVKGDAMIKEGVFSHLKASDFNKSFLETYGQGSEDAGAFPVALGFARGFDRVIPLKAVADVLLRDVGGLRAQDGRWPLVVDGSGRTSTFVKYTGAAVYTVLELQAMELLRLRRALLTSLLHGGAIFVDLGAFDVKIEVLAEKFNDLEKGLFWKLLDRSVLPLGPRESDFHGVSVLEISIFMDFLCRFSLWNLDLGRISRPFKPVEVLLPLPEALQVADHQGARSGLPD